MPENVDVQNSLSLVPETPKANSFRDTVLLPLTDGEYIHVETTTNGLANSFTSFAEQFGIPAEQAHKFFVDKVDFRFGTADNVPLFDTKLDNAWAKLITSLQGGGALGIVGPERDGKYTVCVDSQRIARSLPHFNTHKFKIKDYDRMTTEERIASFQQAIKTVTEHEFFHILQYMKDPEIRQKASKQMQDSYRLFLAFATSSTVMNFIPELKPAIIPVSIPILGAIVYLNRSAISKVEPDAYDAQKHTLGLDIKSPFNFAHESTPNVIKFSRPSGD